jgi:hypothetical protein
MAAISRLVAIGRLINPSEIFTSIHPDVARAFQARVSAALKGPPYGLSLIAFADHAVTGLAAGAAILLVLKICAM